MPVLLTPPNRDRLVKLLGLLSSDHVGERAAAAAKASELVKRCGASWSDLIGAAPAQQQRHQVRPQPGPQCGGDLAFCLRRLATLNSWKAGFVISLSRRPRQSVKQLAILREIAADLQQQGLI